MFISDYYASRAPVDEVPAERRDLTSILGRLVETTSRMNRQAVLGAGGAEETAMWRTLAVLTTSGPVRLGELADLVQVSAPTMSAVVRRLIEADDVKRIADETDARAWLIALTPRGRRRLAAHRDALADALVPAFEDLGADDRDTLRRAADIVAEHTAPEHPENAALIGRGRR